MANPTVQSANDNRSVAEMMKRPLEAKCPPDYLQATKFRAIEVSLILLEGLELISEIPTVGGMKVDKKALVVRITEKLKAEGKI